MLRCIEKRSRADLPQDGVEIARKLFPDDRSLTACNELLESLNSKGETRVALPIVFDGEGDKLSALKAVVDGIKALPSLEKTQLSLLVYDDDLLAASERLYTDVRRFVEENYEDDFSFFFTPVVEVKAHEKTDDGRTLGDFIPDDDVMLGDFIPDDEPHIPLIPLYKALGLSDELKNLDESFSEMLFRVIDEKGISDAECYKKANVDRKVFSKIRTTKNYRPKKTTAVAFAIALELPLDQAKRLIELAGYSLTRNNKFDVIIEYFIRAGKFDLFEINDALYAFDQKLLGY